MSRLRLAALGVGVVVVALVVVFAVSPKASNVAVRTPLIGKPAPAISGASLTTGGRTSLASLRGRFVLVNFFAHWCAPCQEEAPQLDAFAAQHRAAGDASVLGVVFADQGSLAARWVSQHGGSYPVIADPSGQLALRYGVSSPPTSFLIGPRGRVLAKVDGQVTRAELDRMMAASVAKGV